MAAPDPADRGARATVDRSWLTAAIGSFDAGRWRGLGRYLPEAPIADAAAGLAAARDLLVVEGPAEPLAVAGLSPKAMETELLGVPTAAIEHLIIGAGADRWRASRAVLGEALARARDRGDALVVLRVDSDDVATLHTAQEAGFTVCEATISFLADAFAPPIPSPARPTLEIEVHEPVATGILSEAELERLTDATRSWDQNHYRADPRLDPADVDRYYAAWIRNIADGSWSDCLAVARIDGQLAGILSERTDRSLLAASGHEVRVVEWTVALTPSLGACAAMLHATLSRQAGNCRYHWLETQARNLSGIRAIDQSGRARPVRTGYTLHAWIDG